MLKNEANQWFPPINHANAVVKIILFLVIWAAVWLPVAVPLARLVKWHPAAPISTSQKLTFLASLYLIAPFLAWWAIEVEGTSFSLYGLPLTVSLFKSISFGFALGVAAVALTYCAESLLGWLHWHRENLTQLTRTLFPLAAIAFFVSGVEELIFRGLFLNFLLENYSLGLSAIISSLIFAALHLVWERENTVPQLPGLFLMGMVLVGARLVDGNNLGLAIGLHAGWIFILAWAGAAKIYSYTHRQADWIAGKENQPLGSLAGIVVLILTSIFLWWDLRLWM